MPPEMPGYSIAMKRSRRRVEVLWEGLEQHASTGVASFPLGRLNWTSASETFVEHSERPLHSTTLDRYVPESSAPR